MRKNFATVFIIVVVFVLPLNALSETLTLVSSEWAPYIYIKEKKIIGADVDVIREVCKRLGIKAKFQEMPWKRALKYVEIGKADAIFTPRQNKERSEFLYYPSEPLNIEKPVIVALRGSGIKISKLDDLKGQAVGVVRGYLYDPEFDAYQGIRREICDNDSRVLRILAYKRIPLAAFTDEGNIRFICKESDTEVETVYVLNETPSYVAFSKKALGEKGKILAEKFSQVLIRLKEEGVYQKIRSRYLD